MTAPWPLTGRLQELASVVEALRGGCVVLAGEAGVGKSRLQREALAALEADGWTTHIALATAAASSVPLGAFATLVRPAPASDRAAMVHAAIDAIVGHGDGRVVLAVDDAHLLDDTSATAVHQLVAARRAAVIVTIRSGEPVLDAVVSLWKDLGAHRLELRALSALETELMLTSALGGTIATHTFQRLFELSRGNPLYLHELVVGALEVGALVNRDGLWTWRPQGQPSSRLRELLSARLSVLDPAERQAMAILALGEPLRANVLEELTSVTTVRDLERRGLVVGSARPGWLSLVHPVYAEVLRAEVDERGLASAREVLVEALASSEEDLLRAAVLHLEGGSVDRPDLLVRGASLANRATNWALAERLAGAAHRVAPSVQSAVELALALREQDRYAECLEVAYPFLADEDTDGAAHLAGVAAFVALRVSGADEARVMLEQAIERACEGQRRQRLRAYLAAILANTGRQAEAVALCDETFAEPDLDGVALAYSTAVAGITLTATGRPLDALALADKHLAAVLEVGPDGRLEVADALSVRLVASAFDGRISEQLDFASEVYDAAVASGDDVNRAAAAAALLGLSLFAGRPTTGARYGEEFVALSRARNSQGNRPWIAALYAECLAQLGRPSDAREVLDYAIRISTEIPYYFASEPHRAAAWVAAADGLISEAQRTALEASASARKMGWPTFEMIALFDAVRLGAESASARLVDLSETIQGSMAAAIRQFAIGVRDRDGQALDTAASMLASAERVLCAAEASALASAAHSASGLAASARASAARSATLVRRCQEAVTPILRTGPQPDPLTKREREIALLALNGLTNKEIADRLVASVRTIEGHLYQAYTKLGISGRADLATVLEPLSTENE